LHFNERLTYLNNIDLGKTFRKTCFAIQDDFHVLGVGQVFNEGRLCHHGFQAIRQSVVTASFPICSLQVSEELVTVDERIAPSVSASKPRVRVSSHEAPQ
jgi:hypothetical protein